MRYEVKLMYIYSDTIEVEAESKQEAIDIAQKNDIEETFDCYYDVYVTELN